MRRPDNITTTPSAFWPFVWVDLTFGLTSGILEALHHYDWVRTVIILGIPPNLYGVSDVLRDPAYATSVGLLLWELSHGEGQHIKTDEHQRTFMSDLAHIFSRAK